MKKNRKLWAFDTEDDSKGRAFLFNFFDGETHHTFKKSSEAVRFLTNRTSGEFWACNLQYDLVNVFRENLHVLDVTYVGSRVVSAKIHGTDVVFRDTLNHWKISVAEMGRRIGLEKLKARGRRSRYDDVDYCRRDTEITFKFVAEMDQKYRALGCKLAATIGSTALNYFYEHHHAREFHFLSQDRIEFMLRGYYGGRVEIFHTEPIRGSIRYVDVNSLYPSVMLENEYPKLNRHRWVSESDFTKPGMSEVSILAPMMEIPYLPYREGVKLIFPVGYMRGVWTNFEILEAKKLGYKVTNFHRGIEFTSGMYRPFESFVKTLYAKRLESQKESDELMSDSSKLLMNNLYGKFAQGNELTRLIPFKRDDLRHGDAIFGGSILRNEVGDFPKHTNVIWAAYTTAYARHKLFQIINQCVKACGKPLYCDTDSLIFKSHRKIFDDSKALGELKHEGFFNYAHFKLPKLYRLDVGGKSKVRAKGVPRDKAEEFFNKGRVRFKRPRKLREALRRKLTANEWFFDEKELRHEYDKRIVSRSGETYPRVAEAGAGAENQPDFGLCAEPLRTKGPYT